MALIPVRSSLPAEAIDAQRILCDTDAGRREFAPHGTITHTSINHWLESRPSASYRPVTSPNLTTATVGKPATALTRANTC